MIEVYWINRKKQEEKLHGYIESKQFLDKKRKPRAYVESKTFYFRQDRPAMTLDDKNIIVDSKTGEKLGYLKDFKIYDLDNSLWYELSKETGEVLDYDGLVVFKLKGNLDKLDEITFLGFCGHFLEVFC